MPSWLLLSLSNGVSIPARIPCSFVPIGSGALFLVLKKGLEGYDEFRGKGIIAAGFGSHTTGSGNAKLTTS
jgi:hypothetical protein